MIDYQPRHMLSITQVLTLSTTQQSAFSHSNIRHDNLLRLSQYPILDLYWQSKTSHKQADKVFSKLMD